DMSSEIKGKHGKVKYWHLQQQRYCKYFLFLKFCLCFGWCDSALCPFLQYHFDHPGCQIRTRTQRANAIELSKQTGPTEIMFDSNQTKKPLHLPKKAVRREM